MFHHMHAKVRVKLAGLGAQDVTFSEIAKLEKFYPDCTVGEAMRRAGLDSTTLEIDLDGLGLGDDRAADAQG
jgi:hypothetical protein